jgi:polyhydroxyalkanoate synthase subunit PhaC
MSERGAEPNTPDPAELARTMAEVTERSQRVVQEFLTRQVQAGAGGGQLDPLNVGNAFMELYARMLANPAALMETQFAFWRDSMTLWQSMSRRMAGLDAEVVASPEQGDRRFRDDSWQENYVYDYIKQSYLLASRYITQAVRDVDGLDEKTAHKVDFYTRQFVDAMAPTNFVITNPEVMRATLETRGENLIRGLSNLLSDLERGKGQLQIRMTDSEAFELGVNVATSPGKVVYQNELIQLIQYAPSTDKVRRRPLLIIPPWINKFYILDLQPKNSFIRWAVSQGHTVFVISWVNPDATLALKGFDDYMFEGPLAAMGAIEQATGERELNVIGYCLGGTLLSCALAWMKAKGDGRVKSATFFTTMIDFQDPGDLGVFIDEVQLEALESSMQEKGYLEGKSMATTFNMLRANDLIWSFVVNNYLLGKEPFAFDLLYWNSDSTRMPARMHSFYLRNMYQENRLVRPGELEVGGVPIDLSTVKQPAYFISTREDHIAPWKATYAGSRLLGGTVRFVLGASGHIAGVVNPPAADKYGYWVNPRSKAADPEQWLASATRHEGSWWTDWDKWVSRHGGGQVPARVPGEGGLPALEDAPGSYVKVRATEGD